MILCYTHDIFSHHQRNFPQKQMGTDAKTYTQRICRERESTWDSSINSLPSEFREPCIKGEKSIRARWMEDTSRIRPSNQFSQVKVNSQRLKQQAQGLHGSARGPLHTYYSFKLSLIMGLLSVRTKGSLILVPFLRSLIFLLGYLV